MDIELKNYQGSFMRNIIVGLQGALYDTIKIEQRYDDQVNELKIPFFYSTTGSEQFIKDYFLDTDKYCNELSGKVEGTTNKIPRAILKPGTGLSLKTQNMMGSRVRVKHFKRVESEFGNEIRELNSRAEMLPVQFDFEATIRASNEGQMFQIIDSILDSYIWRGIKFYIQYGGIQAIPCYVAFPEKLASVRALSFSYGEEKKPEITLDLSVSSLRPIIDKTTTLDNGQRIVDWAVIKKLRETPDIPPDASV